MAQPDSYPQALDDENRSNEPLRGAERDAPPDSARELADSARDSARERAERARSRELAQPHADEPRAGDNGFGTSFLKDGNTDESWQQWRQIQADFVDNPRNAVSEAHGLVSELVDGIVRQFESERTQLEQRWSSGEDVSTEDLRRCLQRYRDFFGRLLATSTQKPD